VETAANIGLEGWSVLGRMAPYLFFGFLMAGVMSVCVSPEFVERHLGGHGFGPVWKASLLGVPLPLCSCSVIPVTASFRRHGASRAAAASFLLSTPQTGVDSIAVTYALLGGVFAVYRPLAALATGLLGGLLVMLFVQSGDRANNSDKREPCHDACCCSCETKNVVRRALEHGFIDLPRDIGLPLLAGVLIAGVIGALAPPNQWQPYLGAGVYSILLCMALGIPIYVCASASVPIAVGLIHLGASPGAALAFLVAGPAVNAATVTTFWKMLGGRTAAIAVATVVLSALLGGLAIDWLIPAVYADAPYAAQHAHESAGGAWLSSLGAVALLAWFVLSFLKKP